MRDGTYRVSLHDLRRLVLRWPGFDAQCEEKRGWYTVELMAASGFPGGLEDLTIRLLDRRRGYWAHRSHRQAVVLELARRGLPAARDAVYAHFDPLNEFEFAREILDLDGLEGLIWLISHKGVMPAPENSWTFHWWLDDLREKLGEPAVSEWLARESASRPEVAEFARLAAMPLSKPWKPPAYDAEVPSYEILRAQGRTPGSERMSIYRWVRLAESRELERAWRAMETEQDPDWLWRLAGGLSRKPEHCDIGKMVERALAWDRRHNPFARALEGIVDPRVRQLGFDLILKGAAADGLGPVVTNYRSGDDTAILAAVTPLTDDWDVHGTGLDVLRLSDRLDCRDLLLWVYEQTPCSECRNSALRHLIDRVQAPELVLRECLADCLEDTREIARAALP